MSEPVITCPSCAAEIRLTESLAAPLLAATRRDFEARLGAERRTIAEREAAVETARAGVAAEVAGKVEAMRRATAEQETAKARAAAEGEIAALGAVLKERDEKLRVAQIAQAEFLRKTRALEDQARELELTVETRLGERVEAVRDKARADAEEGLRLRLAERDTQIAAMGKRIDELKQRAEQGSQQLQGEVLELDLENRLRLRFPGDGVEPVAKGESGADVIQRVTGPGGEACGAILWESKRTRAWSDGWIAKLKGDQRATGAEVALLVSEALPKGVENFEVIDGVWVASPRCALPLAGALRQGLIGANAARVAREGQATKMEQVYDYLTGPRFRHRVEAIVEKFTAMQGDLNAERRFMQRQWAKREVQIHGVIGATVGMYGDLQGIAGRALKEIDGLEAPLLDPPEA